MDTNLWRDDNSASIFRIDVDPKDFSLNLMTVYESDVNNAVSVKIMVLVGRDAV